MAPSSDRLCAAMASVLRNAKVHDGQKSGADVITKWATIRSNFQSMMDKLPGIRWPHFEVQEDDEDMSGKNFLFSFFLQYQYCRLGSQIRAKSRIRIGRFYATDTDPQQDPNPNRTTLIN
jgi:hypothetical protein